MDGMLQSIIVVFMLFLCSLCLFAIVVIVRDIIHEHSQKKQQKEEPATSINAEELSKLIARAATALADARESESAEELAEAPAEPVAEPAPADKPEDENAVVFSRATLSLEEKYATLSTEYKRFFDDIIKHALGKEGARELKAGTYYNECTADADDTFTLTEDYYPVRFTLTQTSSATGVLGAPISGTLADIKAWVDANYNTTANYDPNTNLAATFELSWEWVYEGGNDLADTVLGNLAAGTSENSAKVAGTDYNLTIHYDLTVTATQIN